MQADRILAKGDFTTYGTSHRVVLALLVIAAGWLVWRGRSLRGTPAADRLSREFALVFGVLTLPLQLRYLAPDEFDLGSLPIQLCDLSWMTALYALVTYRPWAVALTYYWGLTLSLQAIITPDLGSEFPDPPFILYWSMHGLTVVAAIYLTWGLGLAPDWRSYRVAVVATALWAAVVYLFNTVADTNYGFLNAKPESASILDLFGPWPWYVLVEIGIIAAGWALITWPWVIRARRQTGRTRQRGPRPHR
jgi:hypothetical integral membrane protein (TIGR02206 family)